MNYGIRSLSSLTRFIYSVHSSTRNSARSEYLYVRRRSQALNACSVEAGYASVRKWTSKINIFQKKYLIIPINEKYVPLDTSL